MAVQSVTIESSTVPHDPEIRVASIQGDVLIGLQKDAEAFIFFHIEDVGEFKRIMRTWLISQITTTLDVQDRENLLRVAKLAKTHERFPLFGLNMSFTHEGLGVLLGELPGDMDPSFMAGAAAQAPGLNDPLGADGQPIWIDGFPPDGVHGLLIVTGPDRSAVDIRSIDILNRLGPAITVRYREVGRTRRERGHEHFGFKDGVSNPGVRGITKRQNPADGDQGLPGQDLIWPGEFVFGYPGQTAGNEFTNSGPEPVMAHSWMRDGSYQVFRRLRQLVPEFNDFLDEEAERLGTDAALLGARLVGRWRSGAPLLLSPLQDDASLGADAAANNDFEYGDDPQQRRCPYAAHIRKTYPRDDLGKGAGEAAVQTRRIMRQGIPFGVDDGEQKEDVSDPDDRGLMFVCYQTSIEEQFEFIQKSWSNNPNFVFGKTRPDGSGAVTPGPDPIIGQINAPRDVDEPLPNYPIGNLRSTATLPQDFVITTAAAYLFAPSLDALSEILCGC